MKIVCLLRDQLGHVRPIEQEMSEEADFVYDEEWEPGALIRSEPDLVLCVNDFHHEVAECIEASRQRSIPTLVLQDGILEWRCQYENPLFGAGGAAPQHQPVLADKIACMGAQSARQIARWGNGGRVEITGMPRLDHFRSRQFAEPERPGRRILVMTAKKPGFTPAQTETTFQSLSDLRGRLAAWSGLDVVWRITKDLHRELGVCNTLNATDSGELADVLTQVDAVVTTPSTAMVEAMLTKRPVAVLDYHNVPRFVPSAWTITSDSQITATLEEILDPSARKMSYQSDVLSDVLFTKEPAAPRVARLICQMAEFGRAARLAGSQLRLPSLLLGADPNAGGSQDFGLADLYPENESLQEPDLLRLQGRLARAESKIADMQIALRRRGLGYWVEHVAGRLARQRKRTRSVRKVQR